jgi:hypothetical protein
MLHTFGNDEREAAEDNRDVVMPSGIRTPLEVIETQLAFQLFIHALRAPTLFSDGCRHRFASVSAAEFC